MADQRPTDVFMIESLETLQVIAEPLRAQIYELLIDAPLTVRQVAERLGLTAGRLYYHINLMEKHGLIFVAETRTVANLVEKLYRAAAVNLEVAPSLLDFSTPEGSQGALAMLTSILDTAREDLLRSVQARLIQLEGGAPEVPRRVVMNRMAYRLTEAQADQFIQRISQLFKDFEQAGKANMENEAAQAYALTIALNPSFYYAEGEKSEE